MSNIIPQTETFVEPQASQQRLKPWQIQLQGAIQSIPALLAELELADLALASDHIQADFPLRVPRSFVARMEKGNPHDPLLRQILPIQDEDHSAPGYVRDPLEEQSRNTQVGWLQKYHGRVLLPISSVCAIHCRYCFRRHFPYADNRPNPAQYQQLINAIAADTSLKEVILSGGDPLLLSDARLAQLTTAIAAIPHVNTLRIHSRVPIVLPERLDADLLKLLADLDCAVVMVVHANHPHELDAQITTAMHDLAKVCKYLFNQAVLLRGVNDDADTLVALSERCDAAGILPYYLHLPDKVANTHHFDVDVETAKRIMREVAARLPGYLVPKLVQEIPGHTAKQVIAY
jgi:L-lysine 2,3-aminomutase